MDAPISQGFDPGGDEVGVDREGDSWISIGNESDSASKVGEVVVVSCAVGPVVVVATVADCGAGVLSLLMSSGVAQASSPEECGSRGEGVVINNGA